eukprot:symbB.v1.2.031761.t1/scaffold3722.1/size85039/5
MPSQGSQPKLLISEKAITVVDGGKATEVPRSSQKSDSTDLILRINEFLTLRHRGRTTLDFQCESINHTFNIGEMHGQWNVTCFGEAYIERTVRPATPGSYAKAGNSVWFGKNLEGSW